MAYFAQRCTCSCTKCEICQVNAGRERRPAFPLQLVSIENPFEQWGLDVVGEINPNSSKLHKYILTTTDYFSKWTEAIPLKVIVIEEKSPSNRKEEFIG